jgi:hypothetical protein
MPVGEASFDRGDIANEVVAHKIIELAKAEERDPERLYDVVLQMGSCHRTRRAAHISG